jgi:hypothetical protein
MNYACIFLGSKNNAYNTIIERAFDEKMSTHSRDIAIINNDSRLNYVNNLHVW